MKRKRPDSPGNPSLENLTGHSGRRTWKSRVVILLALGALGYLGFRVFLRPPGRAPAADFATTAAQRSSLTVKVTATGNLQPTNKVDVGSETSGIVTQVMVQENDHVKKGQVMAQLDLSKLKDAVTKSKANLQAAQATVMQAQATVDEARTLIKRYEKVHKLSGGKVPSQTEMDTARANLRRARATRASAWASVTQARAALQSDRTNLDKATIRSPINGVVLTRSIEPGQTVAAAFTTPTLFTLAEDLAKMELKVNIDEADVGQVKVGQKATFTVDAHPRRSYAGVITRVSLAATEKDSVISYATVLAVRNDDLSLRPGMTATADIVTVSRENVLVVPNGALRFSPMMGNGPPTGGGGGGCLVNKLMPHPPRHERKQLATKTSGPPRVWVLREGRPEPVEVRTGSTNGKITEIIGDSLPEGTMVITGMRMEQP